MAQRQLAFSPDLNCHRTTQVSDACIEMGALTMSEDLDFPARLLRYTTGR